MTEASTRCCDELGRNRNERWISPLPDPWPSHPLCMLRGEHGGCDYRGANKLVRGPQEPCPRESNLTCKCASHSSSSNVASSPCLVFRTFPF